MGQGNPYIAAIILFAGNFAPRGWAFCEGQLLPISQNTALFSLLGTTYGGDGRTSFALPDLRGRGPIHEGTGPGQPSYRLGQRSGQSTVILNTLEMPSHTHLTTSTLSGDITIGANTTGGNTKEASGNHFGEAATTNVYNNTADEAGESLGTTVDNNLTLDIPFVNTGSSNSHNNMQPYLSTYYIIALQGVFPSRS